MMTLTAKLYTINETRGWRVTRAFTTRMDDKRRHYLDQIIVTSQVLWKLDNTRNSSYW